MCHMKEMHDIKVNSVKETKDECDEFFVSTKGKGTDVSLFWMKVGAPQCHVL